ncbi:cutinase family protein [Rhodococcus rhodnii]|uniref:cutinase family protein n=1 Tax=Rhodococcus rhodnii TaxID=38312 RepID=UPI0009FB726B|nr:cutinase family protein [Rhodococcus rhodnii]
MEVVQLPRVRATVVRGALVTVSLTVAAAAAVTVPQAAAASEIECTPLHVVAVQGTNQSAPDASPTADSGFLGAALLTPLLDTVSPGSLSREYIPYAGDFGWRGQTYEQSMLGGVDTATQVLGEYAARCPDAKFAIVGYSQGAQIADTLAREIGAGTGPVAASDVAAVSLFSSPTRPEGASVFPGAPGRTSPAAPVGVDQSALADLDVVVPAPAEGSGGAPNVAAAGGYGSLAGRVASWCNEGDLACAIPEDAQLARAVTNIAGQLHLDGQDPQQTLIDFAGAFGGAVLRTGAEVINNDVEFTGERFQVTQSRNTVLGRLADNTDPRSATPEADADIVRAVIKTGVMGLQAGVAVAKKVLTPATIGQLAAVGMANPPAALGLLAVKTGEAVLDLFPPATGREVERYIYNEVSRGVEDNKGLIKMATDLKYWDTARNHATYDVNVVDAAGRTAAGFTAAWLSSLAESLSVPADSATGTAGPSTSSTATRTSSPVPATSPAPATSSTAAPSTIAPTSAAAQ